MLARLARELPADGFLYEPKWDGFRCLVFRSPSDVDLRSRHDRPLARYFPELTEAISALPDEEFALDGEIIGLSPRGFDFAALLGRLHPAASRVARLRRETPAALVCFDLLALGREDLLELPFRHRRERLESLLPDPSPPLFLTPITSERAVAEEWLERFQGAGVDGVMAKHPEQPYRPGLRSMIKVKREQTADCVVGGFRPTLDGQQLVASLLLGLYDEERRLQHVGVVVSLPRAQRRDIFAELTPLAVPLRGHPWEQGFLLQGGTVGRLKGSAGRWTPEMEHDWVPVAPERVCEVAFDQLDDHRFRHPARFRRWRPDREAESCMLDQLPEPQAPLAELLNLQ